MKIVLATPLFPPDLGGPATYAKLLAEHFPAKGDEVRLVNFGEVRHLPKGIRHIAYFSRVMKAAQGADVVLALDPVSVGLPALVAARILGKPFVVKIVGDFAWEQGRQRFGVAESLDAFVRKGQVPLSVAFLRMVQTFVARSATRIIVPSNYLKGIVMTWSLQLSSEKISVIYNSVELPASSGAVADATSKAETAPMAGANAPHLVVTVGRLVPWKGMDALIEAIAEVRKEIPDVALMIVGDGPERERLETKAKEVFKKTPGKEGTGISFAGARTHEETLHAIQSAGVFVLNSTYEGLSHTVIEALALGSAIVVSNAGGNPELVQDGVNGLVVPAPTLKNPAENVTPLVNAITRLMKDTSLRMQLRSNAQKSAARFQIPRMLEETQVLLLSVLRSAVPENKSV